MTRTHPSSPPIGVTVWWPLAGLLMASALFLGPLGCAPEGAEAAVDADGSRADLPASPEVEAISDKDLWSGLPPKPQDGQGEDILYPGQACDEDESCSTGLCYGRATPQGAFEPGECQVSCLPLGDFRHYCDSHTDCCSGRCCLECGPKEGLCVLATPAPYSE